MFGEWLKDELKKQKMSQYKLAALIGVTPTHVNHMVHNRRDPSNELLTAIGDALKKPDTEIFRQAGILRQIPPREKQIEEITYIFNRLTDAEKESALTYFRFLLKV